MADDDLYGDLPDLNVEPQQDDVGMDVDETEALPPDAAAQEVRPDEAIAAIEDAGAIKLEEEPPEDLSVEGAFAQIAEALGLTEATPREVLTGFSQMAAEAQQRPVKSLQERTDSIVDQVQIANLTTEVIELRRRLADSMAATQPAAIHLTTMHCDPAIAREFEYLKSENTKLNQTNSQLRSNVAAVHFKPTDDKGRKLVEKLHAAQEELRALEAQLQARDESLAQAHLNAQHAAEMRDTCVRQQAHIQQLQTTVEDLVTSGATLAKTNGRHGEWQSRSGVGSMADDGARGAVRRGGGTAAAFRGPGDARQGERNRRGYRNRDGRSGGKRQHWGGADDGSGVARRRM